MSYLARISKHGRHFLGRLAPSMSSLQARTFATPAPTAAGNAGGGDAAGGEDDDIVVSAFKDQMRWQREVLEGAKKLKLPLEGDDAAVRKWASEMEQIKRQAGVPDMRQVIDARLGYQLELANYDARAFLATFTEGMDLGNNEGALEELMQALDEIEESTGAPVDADNEQGWDRFLAKVQEVGQEYGLNNADKTLQEETFNWYKQQIEELRQSAIEAMESAKRRDGLEWVDVKLGELQPKIDI